MIVTFGGFFDPVSRAVHAELEMDYQHAFLGELRLLESDVTPHPELLVASREVVMRTAYGFIEAPDEDASYLHTALYKCWGLRPDFVPVELKEDGERKIVVADLKERILKNLHRHLLDIPIKMRGRSGLIPLIRSIQLPMDTNKPLIEVMLGAVPQALRQSEWEDLSEPVSSVLKKMIKKSFSRNQNLMIDDDAIDEW